MSILCFGIQGMLDKYQAIVFLFLCTLAQLLFSSLRHIKCQQPLWKCFMFAFEDLVSSSILINQTHQTYVFGYAFSKLCSIVSSMLWQTLCSILGMFAGMLAAWQWLMMVCLARCVRAVRNNIHCKQWERRKHYS